MRKFCRGHWGESKKNFNRINDFRRISGDNFLRDSGIRKSEFSLVRSNFFAKRLGNTIKYVIAGAMFPLVRVLVRDFLRKSVNTA